jgi:hypothetical protein
MMKEQFFVTDDGKPMGRIVLEDDCACVVTIVGSGDKTNARGWACGRTDKLGFALASCAEVTMNKMSDGARFATIMGLVRTLHDKKLLPENYELRVFRDGEEMPLKVEDLIGMLLGEFLAKAKKREEISNED